VPRKKAASQKQLNSITQQRFSACPALVLVGGMGTRLRPVYAQGPKALAPIAGKPFLAYLLESLAAAGLKHVVLCVGYGAEQIEGWVKDGAKFDLRIRYSRETEAMGTAGALGLAYLRFARGQRVLAMNGDSIVQMSLPAMWDWHLKNAAAATIALVGLADTARYGRVEVNEGGWISSFHEKNGQAAPGFINGGAYLFEASVLEDIVVQGSVSLEREVLPAQIPRGLLAFKTSGYFIDIGIPEDYLRAQAELGGRVNV
jgi:D-glycero-alpha-D-manno-heptose 1-phosphate guanylyltransferase